MFDQEPVESLVLSRSKVLGWAIRAALLSAVPSSQHPGFWPSLVGCMGLASSEPLTLAFASFRM